MSRIFIVDTENTNDYRFLDVYKVNNNDSVYLTYTEKSKSLCLNYVRDLYSAGCNIEFIELKHTGVPSGLDFQISTLLGSLIYNFGIMVSDYYIVSDDNGFNANTEMINYLYPNVSFDVISPQSLKKYYLCDVMNIDTSSVTDKLLRHCEDFRNTVLERPGNTYKRLVIEYVKFLGYSEEDSELTYNLLYSHRLELNIMHNNLVSQLEHGDRLYNLIKCFANKSAKELASIIKGRNLVEDRLNFSTKLLSA